MLRGRRQKSIGYHRRGLALEATSKTEGRPTLYLKRMVLSFAKR